MAGGCRFQSHPDLAAYVERFVLEGQTAKLSAAALETLAIVAYKQPISRAQVAAIRGVNVDGVMRTLAAAGLHRRGRPRPGPGPGGAVRHHRAVPREARRSTRSTTCPPLGDFVPGADVVEQLERGLRPDAPSFSERLQALEGSNADRDHATRPNGNGGEPIDLDAELGVDLDDALAGRRDPTPSRGDARPASGCRRCWPRPGSAAGGPARS